MPFDQYFQNGIQVPAMSIVEIEEPHNGDTELRATGDYPRNTLALDLSTSADC
jgi:hypothetical protein